MTKTEDGCGVCCSRQPPFMWREESIESDSCIVEIRLRQDVRRDYMSSLQPGESSLNSINLLPSSDYTRNRVWDENVCLTILMFAFPCLIMFGMKINSLII
ncbi:hypothetical protein Hanom_Chr09g00863511 [Helianthus anomalus]